MKTTDQGTVCQDKNRLKIAQFIEKCPDYILKYNFFHIFYENTKYFHLPSGG